MRGRGGACPARGFAVITTLRVNRTKGFPLWGKLSPQVTDEGVTAGHLPLIRRVPRHLSPKGKAFLRRGGVTPPYGAIKNHCAVGAGYAPPATVYYNEYDGLACRGGIYAARCNHPGNAIYRENAMGRIYASPTNPPGTGILPIVACLPVVRREGS